MVEGAAVFAWFGVCVLVWYACELVLVTLGRHMSAFMFVSVRDIAG